MIPKKIHYCWFGNSKKSKEVNSIIENWKKRLPDYEIIEWNESNSPFLNTFARQALQEKKWAFVSDYVRMYVLKKHGGIYLDTDVEVIKKFDDLLTNKSFLCRESDKSVCTAVIGAESNVNWIEEIINYYDGIKFVDDQGKLNMIPNSVIIFEHLENKYKFNNKNEILHLDNISIYTSDYFSPIDFETRRIIITDSTYAIHHFSATWLPSIVRFRKIISSKIRNLIGNEKFEKIKQNISKK